MLAVLCNFFRLEISHFNELVLGLLESEVHCRLKSILNLEQLLLENIVEERVHVVSRSLSIAHGQ